MRRGTRRIGTAAGAVTRAAAVAAVLLSSFALHGAAGAPAGGTGAAGAGGAARPNFTPGQWEITVVLETQGIPPRPPITSTQCITAGESKDARSLADTLQRRSGKCTVGDLKLAGGSLSYSFKCDRGATGTTEISLAGTSYQATTRMTSPGRGSGTLKLSQHVTARRLGDC